jgi:E3 ubiquitin-protein ligase HUWE1
VAGQSLTLPPRFLPQVDRLGESPSSVMENLLKTHQVPEEKQMQLFTYLRLAASFSDYSKRLKCVQARLHALSILIYSNQMTENVQSLLYSGWVPRWWSHQRF